MEDDRWKKYKTKLLKNVGEAQIINPHHPFLYFLSNSSNYYITKKVMVRDGFDPSFAQKYNMSSIHKNLLFSAGIAIKQSDRLELDSPANILVDSGGFQIFSEERKGNTPPFTPTQIFEWQIRNGEFLVVLDRPAKGEVSPSFLKNAALFTHKNTISLLNHLKREKKEYPLFYVFQLAMGRKEEYDVWFDITTKSLNFEEVFYGVAISVWNFGDLPFLLTYHIKPIFYLLFDKKISFLHHIHYLPMLSKISTLPYLSYAFYKLREEGYVDLVGGDNSTPILLAGKGQVMIGEHTCLLAPKKNDALEESLPYYCHCPYCCYMKNNFTTWKEVFAYHGNIFYHYIAGHNLFALNHKLANLWEKWKYDSNLQSSSTFKAWQDLVDEAVSNQLGVERFEELARKKLNYTPPSPKREVKQGRLW